MHHSLVWYPTLIFFAAKYANPSVADDMKMVIGLLQLPVTAIIIAISVENSAEIKAGVLPKDGKYEGEVAG